MSQKIISDKEIMDGLPIISGTRIPVYAILELLAGNHNINEIVNKFYPSLSENDVKAAIEYAAELSSKFQVIG